MSAIAAVQDAIYSRLAGDSTLVAMLEPHVLTGGPGVLNDVPDGQDYPIVLISGAREKAMHTFGGPSAGKGWDVMVPIFSMSRYRGDREALLIHNRVVALLDFYALTVSGFSQVSCEYAPGGDVTGQVITRDVEKVKTHQVAAEFSVKVRP